MTGRVWRKKIGRRSEQGFTLFFALFAVLFASGYIVVNLNVDRDRIRTEKAQQTAWMLEQIADAARLFVRDADANIGGAAPFNALYNRVALCTTRRAITPATLVSAGYLKNTIGARNPANTDFITPFGQTIQIIAGNSVIGGSCAPGNLTNIAASAYIIMRPGTNTTQAELLEIAKALNQRGLPTIAPRFDAAGGNISPNCAGGRGTIQWDTGCLNETQYTMLTNGIAFANNMFGFPAWLTFRGDNRAIFRFTQPENPQATQMATDLRLAPFADVNSDGVQDVRTDQGCAQVSIRTARIGVPDPSDSTLINSGVCASQNDSAGAGGNRRLDITNASAIEADRVIINPQVIDNNGTGLPVTEAEALLVNTGATITGPVRSYAKTNSIRGTDLVMGGPNINLFRNINGATPRVVTTTLTGGFLQTGNAEQKSVTVNGTTSVAQTAMLNNGVSVTGGAGTQGLLANQLSGNAVTLTIGGDAVVGGTTSVSGNTTIAGGTGFSLAAARLETQATQIDGNLSVGNDFSTSGNATIGTIDSVDTCRGTVCPDRSRVDPPL